MHFVVPIVGFIIIFIALTTGGGVTDSTAQDGEVVMRRQTVLNGIGFDPFGSSVQGTVSAPVVQNNIPNSTGYVTPTVFATPRVTSLQTLSAQDITEYSALLRGTVTATEGFTGSVFFIYGTSAPALKVPAGITTYEQLKNASLRNVSILFASGYVREGESTVVRSMSPLTAEASYAYRMCVSQAGTGIQCGNTVTFTAAPRNTFGYSYFSAPTAYVQNATNIGAYEATITGSYQINSGEEVVVFLAYGDDRAAVSAIPATYKSYDAVREQGEALQKVRLARYPSTNGTITYTLEDLERDTEYYYTLCVGYSGRSDGVVCGYPLSFTTDERDRRTPEVTLTNVELVRGGATLSGTVDMNDYNDGHSFVVYGTDYTTIQAVDKVSSFTSVYQNGDRIQRISIDTDVDGTDATIVTLRNLTPTTGFFTRFCVEYEIDNDYGYTSTTLQCSDVKPFVAI